MIEAKLRERLVAALGGYSPEAVVIHLGLHYNSARTVRNALDGSSGFGRKALGILLMADYGAGPMVLEYLISLVSEEGIHDTRD